MNTQLIDSSTQINSRTIEQLIKGQETTDGAGVKLTRVINSSLHQRLDPFLMLDAFRSDNPQDYIAGFPDHPHRGFETVTYLIAGRMRHHDSAGNEGMLESGGMQWMSAGHGVIHSEMPEQEKGEMEGFQLWVNLPASDKLSAPQYRDIQSQEIPEYMTTDSVRVRVLMGESKGHVGAVERPVTLPFYLDIHLPAGTRFSQSLPSELNACLYVYRGRVKIENHEAGVEQLAILSNGAGSDCVNLVAVNASKVLLIAGKPLHEPIAQHGPFVMNTQEEIMQAIQDYRTGRLTRYPG